MAEYRNAFCVTGARIDRKTTGFGVYDAAGHPLPDTAISTPDWTARPEPHATPPAEATRLFGPALFAGIADKQFGFVLLNAMGRLWALEDLPPETVILFAAKPISGQPGYGFVPVLMRALGLPNPVMITHGNVICEALHTAEERFGESRGGTGTDAFYDWLDRRWPAAAPPDPERRVYVTRSRLGQATGRFACEDHLEALLAAEGYEIYAPETHPLAHQIATFQSAGRLVFAEGSALHLFALVRRPGQLSAVILRRPELPEVMHRQMADRAGTPTLPLTAIREIWWPPLRGEHLSLSVLDVPALGTQLAQAGLIEGGDRWADPPRAQIEASLCAGLKPGEALVSDAERPAWLRALRQARRRAKAG